MNNLTRVRTFAMVNKLGKINVCAEGGIKFQRNWVLRINYLTEPQLPQTQPITHHSPKHSGTDSLGIHKLVGQISVNY